MSNRSENSHIEIGVWDPSSVAKPSSQSPVNHPSQSYGVPASSQHSWHSQPSNNSVGSDFNLSSMRDSMPYQHQQAPVEGNVSNIFYTPSQQGGYIQTSDPTPYSSISGNSMSMMPQSNPPQRAWSTAQPSASAADGSQNWRNPPPQPYNNMQQQYVPYGTPHLNPQQPRQNSTTQNFVNPLISNVDSEAADIKVDRMHKAAQEAEEIKNTMMKKPTTISKGALAVLQKDLKDAAAPFQSPEALKQFRDRQLGILNPETNNYTESSTNINPEQILSSSNLSATAAEFVPQFAVKKAQVPPLTTIDEHDAVEHINQCINNLIVYPACFDSTVPSMLKTLKSYALPESTVQKAVDIIYETCIIEPNFRYLGAQLCDTLARSDTGIPKFRSILLSKAQKEFQNMDNALGSDDITIERARGFTHFVSELFLSLMMERPSGKLERFAILGRAILGVMEKLIKHANDENIQCVVRVLKLTVMSMEDSLKDDEKGSAEKMQSILDNLISFLDDDKQSVKLSKATTNLLSGFKKLRADNWGRVSKEETQAASNTKQFYPGQQESPTNESFMINEPVFFTPDGVQYTAADAADPEFYNKFLARFDDQAYNMAGPSVPDAAQYTTNPIDEPPWAGDYNDWSPADADQFDLAAAEDDIKYDDDDYDVELEMFINKIVG
uniref:Uncharacterized protein LOC100178001 n=1 Tax=Phallusia mammillata TaxID=59560 RepID=A0A6F9DHH5_9ASCI|nr:uncharacterized protein LOC100178001 [Phallusia mammillata]